MPTDADLLIDRVYLACDVPTNQRGEFVRIAREDAFPARHKAYCSSFRSASRKALGHLLRVSYCPRFSPRKHETQRTPPAYAAISFVPPYFFDPRWLDRVGSNVVLRATVRLAALLRLATNVRVTRIEVAVDLAIPGWALQAFCTTSRRFIVHPREDRARTIESGSRSSPISLSTYDKRNQLIDVWDVDLGHELTRSEVRVKLDAPLPLADLPSLPNPFDHVSIHLLEPARDAPAGFKIAVRLARLLGLPRLHQAHRKVPRDGRAPKFEPLPQVLDRCRFIDLLAATEMDASRWRTHPRRVFARQWRRVAHQLLGALGNL